MSTRALLGERRVLILPLTPVFLVKLEVYSPKLQKLKLEAINPVDLVLT